MTIPAGSPHPFVVVSNEQIYDEIQGLRRDVNAMTGNQPMLADHEARIRSMERRWYQLPASLLGFGFGAADLLARLFHA